MQSIQKPEVSFNKDWYLLLSERHTVETHVLNFPLQAPLFHTKFSYFISFSSHVCCLFIFFTRDSWLLSIYLYRYLLVIIYQEIREHIKTTYVPILSREHTLCM